MAQTIFSKSKNDIRKIQEELRLLRSSVIGMIGKDREGVYRPAFVRRIQRALREKPEQIFRDEKSFLEHLRKVS